MIEPLTFWLVDDLLYLLSHSLVSYRQPCPISKEAVVGRSDMTGAAMGKRERELRG